MIGIYKITDQRGRIYIGSSANIEKRFQQHRKTLLNGSHVNKKLRDYYKKYKESAYVYEVVEECSLDDLLKREQFYIDLLLPFYNINKSATKPPSWSGKKHKEETKEKMRQWNIGRKHTIETLNKIKEIRSTYESREQMRINASKSHGMLGKKHTAISLEKISIGNKGKTISIETREKLRYINSGKKASELTKEKMRLAHTGIKHSKESIEKMRQSAILRDAIKHLRK